MTKILGISAFYHDSAAALIENGKIIAAVQEERFTRIKHDSSYPFNAIENILNFTKINIQARYFILITYLFGLSINFYILQRMYFIFLILLN